MTLCADLDVQSIRKEGSGDLLTVCKKVASRHAIAPVTETLSVQFEKLNLTRGKISIVKSVLPEVR